MRLWRKFAIGSAAGILLAGAAMLALDAADKAFPPPLDKADTVSPEVLDADGFKAFKEAHDPFDPATAHRLHKFIYSSGGTRDFATAYRAFRGRDPHIEALLEGRGLLAPAA